MKPSWKLEGQSRLRGPLLRRGELRVGLIYTNVNRLWHEDISQTLDILQIAQMPLFASFRIYITAVVWKVDAHGTQAQAKWNVPSNQVKISLGFLKGTKAFRRSSCQELHILWVPKVGKAMVKSAIEERLASRVCGLPIGTSLSPKLRRFVPRFTFMGPRALAFRNSSGVAFDPSI